MADSSYEVSISELLENADPEPHFLPWIVTNDLPVPVTLIVTFEFEKVPDEL
jgi:hypothetical protein